MRLAEMTARLGICGALLLAGCKKASTTAPAPAATLARKQESDLPRIVLTPEAETRLGISMVAAVRQSAAATRTVGGDVLPSSGRSVSVVAPVAGRLDKPAVEVRAGQTVKRGDALVTLTPVATVDRDVRATADRTLRSAEARLTAMEARLARAEKLLADGAGSARAAEEARVDRDTAKAEVDAARSRAGMLDRSPLASDVSVVLRAPEDAVVRTLNAAPGSMVPAGAPLFELVGTGALWVRASVFVGDVRSLRPGASAQVRPLTAPPGEAEALALPVSGPPTGDPGASTFDLYFALGSDAHFRPGERVAVTLSYAGEVDGLCVPPSAVVRDVAGGAWVYVTSAPHTFERRRVEVERVASTCARIARGLGPDAQVVATGAVELFGFEFGSGK